MILSVLTSWILQQFFLPRAIHDLTGQMLGTVGELYVFIKLVTVFTLIDNDNENLKI